MIDVTAQYALDDAVGYHYGRFPPTNIDYERLARPLSKASAAVARFDAVLESLHSKDSFLAPLRHREAVISSRIEGTIATLDEVLTLDAVDGIDEEDASRGTYRRDAVEVFSYTRALGHAQDLMNGGLPICGRLVRDTHKRMLFFGRGSDKRPGAFKNEQNYIVDRKSKKIQFIPISPDNLETGFKTLEDFINDDTYDPLIQTALAHVEFEALHPFNDGNGRIGRMLITLMMWDKRLIHGPLFYISGQLEDRRDEYISRMRNVSANDEWTEWCSFFLEALEAQATENLETAKRIGALYETMKDVFRELLASRWSINALDYVFGKPIFRNSAFTTYSGIPNPTAARFTRILLEHGLLRTVVPPAGRRSGMYAFEPLLEIVRA